MGEDSERPIEKYPVFDGEDTGVVLLPNTLLENKNLSAIDKLVFAGISTYSGYDNVHPTIEQIAMRINVSRSSVTRSLAALQTEGFLKIRPGSGTGPGDANSYIVFRQPKPKNDALPEHRCETNETNNLREPQKPNINALPEHPINTSLYLPKHERGGTRQKNKPRKKPANLDLVQDLIPWMAAVSGCLGYRSKLNGSAKAVATKEALVKTEVWMGAQELRQRWLDYLASGEWRDKDWPYSWFLKTLKRRDMDNSKSDRKMESRSILNQESEFKEDLVRPVPGARHGVDCPKAVHEERKRESDAYLHAADDDAPYDVDGVKYCGRCHWEL